MNREELYKAQKDYDDYIKNVRSKCPHDQDIVFAMMGDQYANSDEHAYVFKCSKCNGHMWELRGDQFTKYIDTPNEEYICKWVPVTTQEEPRLLKFVGKTAHDYARELFINCSKYMWKDLK